ncbi:complement factor H-like [Rhinoderma darwinii]|uniref:complement factor H-like n=1 Tax=Rhinoderma darwinii TaxID=43563 RepID=UPI003F6654F0
MHRLDLIFGMVSIILCCYVALPFDKVTCGKPPDIENAQLLGNWDEETYPQGRTVNYSCRPGFSLIRRFKRVCLQGNWEILSNGQCKKRSCGQPGDIPFGTFKQTNGHEFVFGAVVEYSCDEGYQMVSKHKIRTCAAQGWTNQPPHCEARLCPPVRDDSVRVLSNVNDDEFSMGLVITLQCKNPKHRLRGPSKIYCTENGTWNMDPPTCKGLCTLQESDMRKNNIRQNDDRVLHIEDNADVQFECVSGYNISDPAKLRIQCNSGILTYPTCDKTGLCTLQESDMRKNNIRLNDDRVLHIEDNADVQFECVSGYNISDPAKLRIQCNSGILTYPTCDKRGLCTLQESDMRKNNIRQNDGRVLHIEDNADVQFECFSGYKISDPAKLRIQCNSGILTYPTCDKRGLCTLQESDMRKNNIRLNDGRVLHIEDNADVQFECVSGYKISDPAKLRIQCNSGILTYPTCNKIGLCTLQESDMRKNNIRQNDDRVLHIEDNADVQFECVSGYKISDPAKLRIQCNSGILTYPTCDKIVNTICSRPPHIPHGEITTPMRDSYHSGSSVKYKCPHLYRHQGHQVIKCQGGMWGQPPVCLEPCTTNELQMKMNNIMLIWNHSRKLCDRNSDKSKYAKKCYVQHNGTIRFACLPGYKISDPKDLRSQCNRGNLPYPRCFKRNRTNSTLASRL